MICRQLGFEGAVTASSSDAFGVGTGSKWANDLQCEGNETSISECKHDTWISVRSCGFAQLHRANSAMCKQPGKYKTSTLRINHAIVTKRIVQKVSSVHGLSALCSLSPSELYCTLSVK